MVPLYKFFHIKTTTSKTMCGTTNLSHIPFENMNGTPLCLTLQKKITKYECVCFAHMWIHMDKKEYMQYDKTSITHGIKDPMVSPLTSS